jgi:hypothetical protein
MKTFRAPDGTPWAVQVRVPSHSNAMVVFLHPTGETAKLNRYAWVNSHDAKALDPRARLTEEQVTGSLTDAQLGKLFRRSMPIETTRPSYIVS